MSTRQVNIGGFGNIILKMVDMGMEVLQGMEYGGFSPFLGGSNNKKGCSAL